MKYAGIDPGSKGYVAVIQPGKPVTYFAIPFKGKELQMRVLIRKIGDHLDGAKVALEEPGMIRGASKTSMAKMYRTLGSIEASLICNDIDYILVPPMEWQKVVWSEDDMLYFPKDKKGKMKRDTKGTTVNCCNRLYPTVNLYTGSRTTPNDNLADAILLAQYAKYKFK